MSDVEPASRRRPPALGRGLSALFGDAAPARAASGDGIAEIPLDQIAPHPGQPRRYFDDAALDELAASIAARGVLQPIVLRAQGDARYQIVAGERRWRAAGKAGLETIPAIVRGYDEGTTLEVALIENIQREQLNAIEEGQAYRRLIDDHGHSQEGLAKLLHKSRSHVANLIRLCDLPEAVRDMLGDGRITMGHARALIGVEGAVEIAEAVAARGLSVRKTESMVRTTKSPRPAASPRPSTAGGDIALLERQLGDMLGLRVALAHRDGSGSVTVHFTSLDQLDMICQRLSGGTI